MMEYKIVTATNNEKKLIALVGKMISEGWKPQGGVTVVYNGLHFIYYQAMIKKD